jgi:hypothetical protein
MSDVPQFGLASNPANGINNIPLNESSDSGVKPDELISLLNEIVADPNSAKSYKDKLEDIYSRISTENESIKNDVSVLINSLYHASNPRKVTKDPQTGKPDKGPKELSINLINKLKEKYSEKVEEMPNSREAYNHRVAQKKKKKTRGNPFRVLMGKVGKLLDHGVEKKDITRYLAKSNYWTNETIEKAVDLVKDYNKKKKRKEASVDSNTRTASLELYETTPDFTKMSTAELITRVLFLDSVLNTSKSHNSGKEPIKDGAKAQLKAIKAAIIARGFDDEELQMLGLGLKKDA